MRNMASLRAPLLRQLAPRHAYRPTCLLQQRRWAQVHDVRFLATTQEPRIISEKYRAKLEAKAREQGLRDIGELKDVYKDKIQDLRKKDAVEMPLPPELETQLGRDGLATDGSSSSASSPQSPTPPRVPEGFGKGNNGTDKPGKTPLKPLSSILDLDKARALPTKELSAVWRLRHASNPSSLCAVIPSSTYRTIEGLARQHPQFVLPVPRQNEEGNGAEMHFLQWVFDAETQTSTVLFTQLAEFKLRGEFAQPHTSVTHYWDSQLGSPREKAAGEGPGDGVVLMAGRVEEGRGASVDDAKWLLMLMQRFYGGWQGETKGIEERTNLLKWFGQGDERFSVEKLLEEAEKMG